MFPYFNPKDIIVVFSIAAVIELFLYAALCRCANKVKWIKKETESLEALLKDINDLWEEGARLESQVRDFWDSQTKLPGIHLQLTKAERKMVDSIKKVACDAKHCVINFHKQRSQSFPTTFFRVIPIIDVIFQLGNVNVAIQKLRSEMEKDANKHLYESMKRTRSYYRSLVDPSTIQESKFIPAQPPKPTKSSTSIEDLLTKSADMLSDMGERWSISLLIPLDAFLKDLSPLQLETETEKVWKKEAEEFIAEAEALTRNMSRWASTVGNIPIARSYYIKKILMLMRNFKGNVKRISTATGELLKKKDLYGVKFIDRAAEKSFVPSTYPTGEDTVITSAIIRVKLARVTNMNSLCEPLERMHKNLLDREESAARNACLGQIKGLVEEVERYTHSEPGLKFEQIKQATALVERIVEACHVTRQKSYQLVGLGRETGKLVSNLTSHADNPSVISIVGMMGVGKTALAKEIFQNRTIVGHFPIRVWMTVPRQGDVSKAPVILIKEDGSKDQTLCVTEVRNYCKQKRCLIVLDDVWSTKDWDQLKPALSGMRKTNTIKLLITTRSKNVALHVDKSSTLLQLRLRTKEESWRLFQMVTPYVKFDSKGEELAKKVVGRCGGLPLAIIFLGLLMSANDVTMEQLLWALERINQGKNKISWLQARRENYENLNEIFRNCLSYFTHFPVDYEIPARRLVALWVAEGLVQDDGLEDKGKTPEDVAEDQLEKLRDCNIIQAVKLKSNGKISTCRLPSMLRELILQDNKNRRHLSMYLQKRFAYYLDHDDNLTIDPHIADLLGRKRNPIAVLFFDTQRGYKPGQQIGNILSIGITSGHFKELKVLDLERVYRPQLPKIICNLVHLKYLGLRWTFLEEIAPVTGKFFNLETLDVHHTKIRTLPSSIWRLKKLRNLYLDESSRCKLEGKPSGTLLENLQTLWGLFIDGKSPLLHRLHRLTNLRRLKLSLQLTQTEQEELTASIAHLDQLHSLRLRSIDERGEVQDLILNDMSKMKNLKSLHLFGNLGRLSASRLPPNLRDLTLSFSQLRDDPLPELEKLSELTSLYLDDKSFIGKFMNCKTGSFPQLRVLRLRKLEDLEEWGVEEGAMPNLMKLDICSCSKLNIPEELKDLKTLDIKELQDMPIVSEDSMNIRSATQSFRQDSASPRYLLKYDAPQSTTGERY